MTTELPYIYGKNPIFEAIVSDSSKIERIFFCYGINNPHILSQSRKHNIQTSTLDKNKFKELEKKICPKGSNSQGIIALLSLVNTIELSDYLSTIDLSSNPIIVIIDGITDPHNLGAITRSAECAGFNSIIITEKYTSPITPVVLKSSAGAINHLKIIKVQKLINTCEKLKEKGF